MGSRLASNSSSAKFKRFRDGVDRGFDKSTFVLAMLSWIAVNLILAERNGLINLHQIDVYLNARFLLLQLLANVALFSVFVSIEFFRGHNGTRSTIRGWGFRMAELSRSAASKQMLVFGAGMLVSASSMLGEKSALLIKWGAWANFPEILLSFALSIALGSTLIYFSGVVSFKFK